MKSSVPRHMALLRARMSAGPSGRPDELSIAMAQMPVYTHYHLRMLDDESVMPFKEDARLYARKHRLVLSKPESWSGGQERASR